MKFKNSFIGYFLFYYQILGSKTLFYLALCILVSLFDGIGIAMFIPLLEYVGGAGDANAENMGQLHYLIDGLKYFNININLLSVVLVLTALFLFKGIMRFVQLKYQVNLRHIFIKQIRFKLVENLEHLSFKGFLKLDAGRIQNTLTTEVQKLFQTMNFYFNAAQGFVMLLTYIALAFLANYQFAVMVAIGAGITNLIYRKIYISTKTASVQLSNRGHDFNGFLIQAINHFKYLKATNYFKKYGERISAVIDDSENLNRKIGIYTAITTSVKEPMIVIVVLGVILLQVQAMGASLISIVLSLLLFYRALSFLVAVQNSWQNFIVNVGAMDSIARITNEMQENSELSSERQYDGFRKEISLVNINFSYGDREIIRGINLAIPKNKTVALVGESGSGKTTLANIIAGLVRVDSGKILVDNCNLDEFNIYSFRSKIGYISQEPVIFNDTVYNNVTFWADKTPENLERFWRVINLASLETFIQTLSLQENSILGDSGILISGGQKQRISIARELFKQAEILLFDEATSALDSETERVIQENIERLRGSYTMIIIAHRLSTVKDSDIIHLMDKGSIIASGDFNTMVQTSEKFKKMVSLQEF